MGDHFVLLVDRLLTESSLEAAIESKNQWQHSTLSGSEDMMTNFSANRMDVDIGTSQRKLVQCRICHDEDEDLNMEVPCSCAGSLKVSHNLLCCSFGNLSGGSFTIDFVLFVYLILKLEHKLRV